MISNRNTNNDIYIDINDTNSIDLTPILFDTEESIVKIFNGIKSLNLTRKLYQHLLVSTDGHTYLLDDVLNTKITNQNNQIRFLFKNAQGYKEELSIENIQKMDLSDLYKGCFVYNRALADVIEGSNISEPKFKHRQYIHLLELTCDIQRCALIFPAMTPDGNTYSRAALESWLESHDTDPAGRTGPFTEQINPVNKLTCRVPLTIKDILPNYALQSLYWTYFDYNITVRFNLIEYCENEIAKIKSNQNINSRNIKQYEYTAERAQKEINEILKTVIDIEKLMQDELTIIEKLLSEDPHIINPSHKEALEKKLNNLKDEIQNIRTTAAKRLYTHAILATGLVFSGVGLLAAQLWLDVGSVFGLDKLVQPSLAKALEAVGLTYTGLGCFYWVFHKTTSALKKNSQLGLQIIQLQQELNNYINSGIEKSVVEAKLEKQKTLTTELQVLNQQIENSKKKVPIKLFDIRENNNSKEEKEEKKPIFKQG